MEADSIVPTETIGNKSLPYKSLSYVILLADYGSYLIELPGGISDESELACQELLTRVQTVLEDTLFRDDLFLETCAKVQDRNKARVVEDISPLIFPSAEILTTYGAIALGILVFNIDERWSESVPITGTPPQTQSLGGI